MLLKKYDQVENCQTLLILAFLILCLHIIYISLYFYHLVYNRNNNQIKQGVLRQMSCFMGISVEQNLDPLTYESALSQMQDYIYETNFKIIPNEHLFIITNKYQKFYLSKISNYIHSNLQHFLVSSETDQQFVQTIVQCLMILKQHFPHKIQIEMVSNLSQIFYLKVKVQQQIPRRLVNHLKILYQQSNKIGLKYSQVQMLIGNLVTEFHKDYKQKIKSFSLKILAQGKIDATIWAALSKQQRKIIDQVVNQPLYQKTGIQILERIMRNNDFKTLSAQSKKQNVQQNSFRNKQDNQSQTIPEFHGPLDVMTALFQLKQSLNISRIAWIIENVQCQKLTDKKLNKFDKKVKQVAEKFLQGYYPQVPLLHSKNFGRCLSQYEMRRTGLNWNGLIEEVLIKIQQKENYTQKSKSKIKSKLKQNKL